MIHFHAERILIYKQRRELKCLQGSFCSALKYDNDGGKIPSFFMAKGLQKRGVETAARLWGYFKD